MAYDTVSKEITHNIILEGRERMSISGVEDVDSFDEESVVMYTSKGTLIIRGTKLQMEKLTLDNGEVSLTGKIDSIRYDDTIKGHESFWAKLFG